MILKIFIDWIFVKCYGFLSSARNIYNDLSSKCGQKIIDSKKSNRWTQSCFKKNFKKSRKAADSAGDTSGYKMADKVTGTA